MKYLLDNDAFSLALRGHERLSQRILSTPYEDVWISGIAVEEMLRGSLAAINTERTRPHFGLQVLYARLADILRHLSQFNILPYDDQAEALYRSWPASVKRVGHADCRTAALAIVHQKIVVTCNGKDFSRLPGALWEDWTR